MDKDSTSIESLENELESLVKTDKNNWTRFYILIKKVEEERLYEQKNFKSFTAWIKNFAIKNKIHESILWNRKKAGKVYEKYQEEQARSGIETSKIEDISVGMDSLVLIDKIQSRAPEIATELIEKTLNKELTREDLRTAYKQIRGVTASNKPAIKKNSEDNNNEEGSNKENNSDEAIEKVFTANKITQLLKDSNWLLGYKVSRTPFAVSEEQDKYITLPEFRTYTGTTAKSRRIDVLALENVTVNIKTQELHAHGIEIKVNKSDLINDCKYTEYSEFVHFLWLAVPRELASLAEELAPPSVGIVVAENNNTLTKLRAATKGNPLGVLNTFMVATMKLM